jgi:hypothetical protein
VWKSQALREAGFAAHWTICAGFTTELECNSRLMTGTKVGSALKLVSVVQTPTVVWPSESTVTVGGADWIPCVYL